MISSTHIMAIGPMNKIIDFSESGVVVQVGECGGTEIGSHLSKDN